MMDNISKMAEEMREVMQDIFNEEIQVDTDSIKDTEVVSESEFKQSSEVGSYIPCRWLGKRPNTRCASCPPELYCTNADSKWHGERAGEILCQEIAEYPNRCNLDYEVEIYKSEVVRNNAENNPKINYTMERLLRRSCMTKRPCRWLKTNPRPICDNPDSKFCGKDTSSLICIESDDYDCAWQYYLEYQSPKEGGNEGGRTTKRDT